MSIGCRELPEKLFFTGAPCRMRLFRRVEHPDVFTLAVKFYVSAVTALFSMEKHALKPACVVSRNTAIDLVLRTRSQPQIGPSVVRRIVIDVVDFFWRPFARHHQPDDAVRAILSLLSLFVEGNHSSTVRSLPTRWFSQPIKMLWVDFPPRQHPAFRVVIEQATDVLRREVVTSAFVSHLGSIPGV